MDAPQPRPAPPPLPIRPYRSLRTLTWLTAAFVMLRLVSSATIVITAIVRERAAPIAHWVPGGAILLVALTLPATLAAFVVWMVWIHRAYANLPALGSTQEEELTPGWAVGYFFIPVINLVHGYRAIRGLWSESRRLRGAGTLVGWWWATTLWAFVMAPSSKELSLHDWAARSYGAGQELLYIIDGALFVAVLFGVARWQQQQYERQRPR